MKIKIINHDDGSARVIDYPCSVLQFVNVHFTFFGIYKAKKTGRDAYDIFEKFDGRHVYTISKARVNDPVTE